jgi:hypothetical protein
MLKEKRKAFFPKEKYSKRESTRKKERGAVQLIKSREFPGEWENTRSHCPAPARRRSRIRGVQTFLAGYLQGKKNFDIINPKS